MSLNIIQHQLKIESMHLVSVITRITCCCITHYSKRVTGAVTLPHKKRITFDIGIEKISIIIRMQFSNVLLGKKLIIAQLSFTT